MELNNRKAIIITYYKASNYGAFLQAYSLQEFLKKSGIDVEFCDYGEMLSKLTEVLFRLTGKIRIGRQDLEYRKRLSRVIKDAVKRNISVAKKRRNYDVAILGSDEIWNINNVTAPHNSIFYKKYKHSNLSISYAASAGNASVSDFKFCPWLIKQLGTLDGIGVRDDITEKLIIECRINKEINRVVDPTFFLNIGNIEKKEIHYDNPYIFVYTYGISNDYIRMIRFFSKEKGLKIVATGCYCKWADYNPIPSPEEWISLIDKADYVFTSTFHGTVFSILLKKNFIVTDNGSEKIHSLLVQYELLDRRISNHSILVDTYIKKIDYEDIESKINLDIQKSRKYILSYFN